jgi:hypothetical protein
MVRIIPPLAVAAALVTAQMHSGSSPMLRDGVKTLVLSGEVTAADKGTYQEHTFPVPAGVTRLDFEFTHSHKDSGTQLEIGLFDPERFRGTSRFSKERFHIAEEHATPSYLPGRIVAGVWRATLGIPAIAAATQSTWSLRIDMTSGRTHEDGLAAVLNAKPGWYVGDLHSHTLHSDAYGCQDPGSVTTRGCQPWELVEAARARGLDFLAITDHNTVSHHAELATLQESLTRLLLMRGEELTTFHGHANVWGTSAFIDFRLGFKGRTMGQVLDDVQREHAVLSINHPARETGDTCTGCGWDAPQTPWDRIHVMEVVNGLTVEGPTAGLPFWYEKLNAGNRMTAVGGSDDHAAKSDKGRIGTPATVIFARALSEAALLDGIQSGQVYIRTRGPEGPALELTAAAGGGEVPMGGVVSAPDVTLNVRVGRAAGQSLEVVRTGEVVATLPVEGESATLVHRVALRHGQWVHVRLRDTRGLTAISNPIYAK